MSKLLLIDGHNILFKAYAVPFRFESKKGTPLHVVTTYLSQIRRAIKHVEPDLVGVVFDSDAPTDNSELSEDYKANREDFTEHEDSPYKHLPHIQKALDALGVAWIEMPGHEADDIIASVSTDHIDQGDNNTAIILSRDSDFWQLLKHSQISCLHLLSKGRVQVYDRRWFIDEHGFEPEQYVYYKSLVGDTADNIRGIAGIGKVRAKEVIAGTRSLSDSPDIMEIIQLNKLLITLNTEVNCQDFISKLDSYNSNNLGLKNSEIFELCEF